MVILFRFMGIFVFCFFVFGFFFIFEIGILEFVFFFGFVLFRGFLFEFFSNDNFFIIGLRVIEFSVFDVVEWVMRLVYWEEIRLLLSWLLLKKLFFKILDILDFVVFELMIEELLLLEDLNENFLGNVELEENADFRILVLNVEKGLEIEK